MSHLSNSSKSGGKPTILQNILLNGSSNYQREVSTAAVQEPSTTLNVQERHNDNVLDELFANVFNQIEEVCVVPPDETRTAVNTLLALEGSNKHVDNNPPPKDSPNTTFPVPAKKQKLSLSCSTPRKNRKGTQQATTNILPLSQSETDNFLSQCDAMVNSLLRKIADRENMVQSLQNGVENVQKQFVMEEKRVHQLKNDLLLAENSLKKISTDKISKQTEFEEAHIKLKRSRDTLIQIRKTFVRLSKV